METQSQVWYVTGASEGLGLNLVKQLLAAGYKVAATSRNAGDLKNALGCASADFLPIEVNLSNESSVSASLQATANKFGKIDFIVNNADCPLEISFDQLNDKEARAVFEINVFGMMNVIRNAMPHLRKNQSGHIFNVSSAGGFSGAYPGFSIYCAAKFAIAGVSESLAAEAKPFGINVTVVLPGQFGSSNQQFQDPGEVHHERISKDRYVDPAKAATLMINIATEENPPLYLFLGKQAYQAVTQKMDRLQKEMCVWETRAIDTDVDE